MTMRWLTVRWRRGCLRSAGVGHACQPAGPHPRGRHTVKGDRSTALTTGQATMLKVQAAVHQMEGQVHKRTIAHPAITPSSPSHPRHHLLIPPHQVNKMLIDDKGTVLLWPGLPPRPHADDALRSVKLALLLKQLMPGEGEASCARASASVRAGRSAAWSAPSNGASSPRWATSARPPAAPPPPQPASSPRPSPSQPRNAPPAARAPAAPAAAPAALPPAAAQVNLSARLMGMASKPNCRIGCSSMRRRTPRRRPRSTTAAAADQIQGQAARAVRLRAAARQGDRTLGHHDRAAGARLRVPPAAVDGRGAAQLRGRATIILGGGRGSGKKVDAAPRRTARPCRDRAAPRRTAPNARRAQRVAERWRCAAAPSMTARRRQTHI